MGLFDTVKNAVTGGAADVHVEVGGAEPGASVPVRVKARANADAEISSVYLLVRATEWAEFEETEFEEGEVERETEAGSKVVFNERFDIAGPQELAEGEEYTWEGSFEIPASANPTFEGHIIEHGWQIQAGLDMTGNDPDSGWEYFHVG
jgi:hypothetical protein